MNRERWRDLQRSLHPEDLLTVQDFAERLLSCEPFVFAYDGKLSLALAGPGVDHLAGVMIEDMTSAHRGALPAVKGLQ